MRSQIFDSKIMMKILYKLGKINSAKKEKKMRFFNFVARKTEKLQICGHFCHSLRKK